MVGIAGLPQSRSPFAWTVSSVSASLHVLGDPHLDWVMASGITYAAGKPGGELHGRYARHDFAGRRPTQRFRHQSVFVNVAGRAHAAGSRRAETVFVFCIAPARGVARALPAAHGLFRYPGRGREAARYRARDLSRRVG